MWLNPKKEEEREEVWSSWSPRSFPQENEHLLSASVVAEGERIDNIICAKRVVLQVGG